MDEHRKQSQRLRRLKEEIRAELAELEEVVRTGDELTRGMGVAVPDELRRRGLATFLQDFYTGCERIFQRIAEEFDGGAPSSSDWHRRLLNQMARTVEGFRPAVLSEPATQTLDEYLRFRHLFRNLYGRHLDWERMRPLLAALPGAFRTVRGEIESFFRFIDRLVEVHARSADETTEDQDEGAASPGQGPV
ncbi:ribonuclease toxin HepT-like protein [Limnochorda pilosa]|uniref:HepT-like domain-containing protein n=1 Tax=Limnochorda pilosa TaxID=1555112 RepID=A0A0K2SJP6_LIMPI|nr:hypothetical protein [Limnochorda pilosa]BAS27338.1 hypothetical protein LIP_1490 [Limnochorda pilosa]